MASPDKIRALVEHPQETLRVELKQWFDPDSKRGSAKLVKACLALRNSGGGYLVLGFCDGDARPDIGNGPLDVRAAFHQDKIQGLVSKYASDLFEVKVHYPARDGQRHVVLEVAAGARFPVAAQSDLLGDKPSERLIRAHAIYVRSLKANNTVSTAEARAQDWPELMRGFLENHEVDIGRFIQRHLQPEHLASLRSFLEPSEPADESGGRKARNLLESGKARFDEVVFDREVELPSHGALEAAVVLEGPLKKYLADHHFRELLVAAQPGISGAPPWTVSFGSTSSSETAYVYKERWEAFMWLERWRDLTFWIADPSGRFYHLAGFEDDLLEDPSSPKPMTELDYGIAIARVYELLAVSVVFARRFALDAENVELRIALRWSRLKGRTLSSWARPMWVPPPRTPSVQETVISELSLSSEASKNSLIVSTHSAMRPLFRVFGGYEVSLRSVEKTVAAFL